MRSYPVLTLAALASPVVAQDIAPPAPAVADRSGVQDPPVAAQPDDDLTDPNQIVVVATRIKGQIDAPQPPIATYKEADIAALGAASISEVLTRISPQTGSGRGRGDGAPVILVNGQRISNFREMRNYPPEALKRIEVLPEEVALRFGYPPDSRVVNLILKDDFRSRSVEAAYAVPTLGGYSTWQLEGTSLKINGPGRFSITGSADDTSPLFENERGVRLATAAVPGTPDPAAYRTLIADTRNFALNTSWSRGLGKDGTGGQISLNGNVTQADSRSGSGLDALTAPLERISHQTTVSGGGGYNTNFGQWQLSATLDATHDETKTLIDRYSGNGADTASSNSERITSLATLTGRPVRLPAGAVTMTAKAGYNWSNIASQDTRSALGSADLTRGRITTGVNVGIPLTSRRANVLSAVGDVSINLSAGYDHLSDFGNLTDWSAGVTWGLTARLGLQASYIVTNVAPSLTQLGAPQTLIFNAPIYDFATGQSVLATVFGGGNPNLLKERQRDLKLSANWQLPVLSNSSLLVEYFRNRSDNVTAGFPLLTPAIEAAFPARITRDAAGRLIAIDRRPITLAAQTGTRLRWGLNLSGNLGKASAESGGMFGGTGRSAGARPASGPRPGGGGAGRGGGGGMMGAMMGSSGQGRWSFGLYDAVQFSSRVLVAPGGPTLDLLNGDALNSSGGTARHTIETNGGLFYKGFGSFMQGTWTGPTRVAANGIPGSGDLRFGAVAKINLTLFANLAQQRKLIKQAPFFKGSRLSLRVENILNSRQKVTDTNGTVPLSYQPDYIDPQGRLIRIEFRKLF